MTEQELAVGLTEELWEMGYFCLHTDGDPPSNFYVMANSRIFDARILAVMSKYGYRFDNKIRLFGNPKRINKDRLTIWLEFYHAKTVQKPKTQPLQYWINLCEKYGLKSDIEMIGEQKQFSKSVRAKN